MKVYFTLDEVYPVGFMQKEKDRFTEITLDWSICKVMMFKLIEKAYYAFQKEIIKEQEK